MARPRKNAGERKGEALRIPVTADQKDLIVRAAQEDGLDMATWARPILIRAAQKRVKRK